MKPEKLKLFQSAEFQSAEEINELFGRVLAKSPAIVAVCALDDGMLIEANETFLNLINYSRDEAIGRTTVELGLWPDQEKSHRQDRIVHILSHGGEESEEIKIRSRDGKIKYVVVSSQLIYVGGRACAVGVGVEITERKAIEKSLFESESKLNAFFEMVPAVLWAMAPTGRLLFANERWHEYSGSETDPFPAMSWKNSIHPEDLKRLEEPWKNSFRDDKPFEAEVRFKHGKTKEYRWFLVRGRIIATSDEKMLLGAATDIHDQKIVQDHLTRSQEHMKRAKRHAEEASLAKSEFLANMSHEIRTPLTAIIGFSELALRKSVLAKDLDPSISNYLQRIQKNTCYLKDLVNDILDLSKIEVNKFDVEKIPFGLEDVLDEVLDNLGHQAELKGLKFYCDTTAVSGYRIFSDPTRFKQILINILGNAIKFTAKGKVSVFAEFKEMSGKTVLEIIVTDTGCGIEPLQQEKLFQSFTQVDSSTTRRYGGTGLGLYLSRRLARLLGGDVKLFNSVPGRGSVFQITIDPGNIEPLHLAGLRHSPPVWSQGAGVIPKDS